MAKRRAVIDIKQQTGFKTIALLCLFVLYAPILILVLFSFNSGNFVMHWEGFSPSWYGKAVMNEGFHSAAKNTLIISFLQRSLQQRWPRLPPLA